MLPRRYRRSDHTLPSVVAALLLASAAPADTAAAPREGEPCPAPKPVIGWAENVRLLEVGVEQRARIDTGAGLAAIDADIIDIRKGDLPSRPDRVVFTIDDGQGGSTTLDRDIVDWVKIKNKGTDGSTARPVVMMTICLAGQAIVERMTLAERHTFTYPILIGRNLLKAGGFLVDSERSFTRVPVCEP